MLDAVAGEICENEREQRERRRREREKRKERPTGATQNTDFLVAG